MLLKSFDFIQKMQKGESSQFSSPIRQTGGSSDAFLGKSLRKEKLRRLSSVFSDHTNTTTYASIPRKLRSALEKRQHESQRTQSPTLLDSRKEMDEFEWRLKDCTKKHKTAVDEYKYSKQSLITKDEEEAAQALFALAQTLTGTCLNKTAEVEPSLMHVVAPHEAEDANVESMSKKRCLVHVYICRFIRVLQTTESEGVAHVNVISESNGICRH